MVPEGTRLLPSDFGFFAVTEEDLVALRPGSSRASAPRDVADLDVVPVSGTSAGLVTADGTIAVISSDYERERCGVLPVDAEVLSVDRGFAVLGTDGGARLWALSGGGVVRAVSGADGLSMGMTSDLEVAVQEGATVVRVGRALLEGLSDAARRG